MHNKFRQDRVNEALAKSPEELLGYATMSHRFAGVDESSQVAPVEAFREEKPEPYVAKKPKPGTQAWVRYWFTYDEVNGGLKHRRGRRKGQAAGKLGREYKRVAADGQSLAEHRAVYLYHHGELPEYIDHKNRVPCDNRIENLRPATASQNGANRRKPKTNTTGFKGVVRSRNRVRAQLCFTDVHGRKTWLGPVREDSADAAADYLAKAKEVWNDYACAGNDEIF